MPSSVALSLVLETIADAVEIDNESTIIPYALEDIDENRDDICQLIVGKQCKVIDSYIINDEDEDDQSQSKTMIVCRDLEQGHYLVVVVQYSTDEDECLASYLYLFSQTKEVGELESTWSKITCKASDDDWVVLDEILEDIIFDDDSSKQILLIYKDNDWDAVDEEIASSVPIFLEQVDGFIYDREDEQLPALMVVDCEMQRGLCGILNHPDGFAKNVIVWDEFEEVYLDSRYLDDLHSGYTALRIEMGLRQTYIPLEDTIEAILEYVEDGDIDTDILEQLNEHDRAKVERIILEREDIILRDKYISDLKTLSSENREKIANRRARISL